MSGRRNKCLPGTEWPHFVPGRDKKLSLEIHLLVKDTVNPDGTVSLFCVEDDMMVDWRVT
jgi:hypothetical protein